MWNSGAHSTCMHILLCKTQRVCVCVYIYINHQPVSATRGPFHQHFWQKVNGEKRKVISKLQKKLELCVQKIFEAFFLHLATSKKQLFCHLRKKATQICWWNCHQVAAWVPEGNSYWKEMLSTVDLLVLPSLDLLLFILQTLFTYLQNKLR